jgi:glutamine amidotransferase
MIAIIDYKCGNLFLSARSLSYIGATTLLLRATRQLIRKCDKIILPGVGAFEAAAQKAEG